MVAISQQKVRAGRSSSWCTLKNVLLLVTAILVFKSLPGDNDAVEEPKHRVDPHFGLGEFKDSGGNIRGGKDKEAVTPNENRGNPDEGMHDPRTDDSVDDHEKKAEPAASIAKADWNPIVINKKGTGPTKVGYVKDFVDERMSLVYRKVGAPTIDHSAEVCKLTKEKSVTPCHNEKTGTIDAKCLDKDTPLIAYNSESFPRTWCGEEIKPNSAIVMAEHCTDPVAHLFPVEVPPIKGDHMPPIIIKSQKDKKIQEGDVEHVTCDIPCRIEKGLKLGGSVSSFIDGETWKMKMLQNDNRNIRLEREDYKKDNYFSTQSLLSSVPLTTFDPKIHSMRNKPAIDFDTAEEKAIYLAEDHCSSRDTKRNRWFESVQAKMTVDSYGKCGNNKEVPAGMTKDTAEGRIELMKKYRIVLALEETKAKDAISEMVWEAFASGAVPVIIGADNLTERLPPKSFIFANNFSTYGELGEYVKKVATDKALWESYHVWRKDEKAIATFEAQYEFGRADVTCRMCRWAYAKKYGLGWNHKKQEVRSIPKVPKEEFCTTADHALVSKPFTELWVTKEAGETTDNNALQEDSEGATCSSLATEGDIAIGAFKGHRKVNQHDGVTDFTITDWTTETKDTEATLRLNFPGVRNPEGACIYNTHTAVSNAKGSNISSATIQDDTVKVTILASWDTTITSTSEGIMEIVVNNGTPSSGDGTSVPRRVRVIIEEMNVVYDKMTEYLPSTYCRMMTNDFINPLGVFVADS